MHLSYWEKKSYFTDIEFVIIGSGIVGLFSAYFLKKQKPDSKILILERSFLPYGASTRNAGFACFGSIGEILDDLVHNKEEEVFGLYEDRYEGLSILLKVLGQNRIDYRNYGGFELFDSDENAQKCLDYMDKINNRVANITGSTNTYLLNNQKINESRFSGIKYCIENTCEGQIDTSKMMKTLLNLVKINGIEIINGLEVENFLNVNDGIEIHSKQGPFIKCKRLLLATNGFAKQFFPDMDVEPARAQVMISKPMPHLKIKGSFHFNKGYVYFRNIDQRVLIGGGRDLDFKGENTFDFGNTKQITDYLHQLLSHNFLPGQNFETDMFWSGIMGVGNSKKPIIKEVKESVFCAVRMGGMGVALGSLTGYKAAKMLLS